MTEEFKFVDGVWAEEGDKSLTVALSKNGGLVRLTLHFDQGPIAVFTVASYRMKRIADALAKALIELEQAPESDP